MPSSRMALSFSSVCSTSIVILLGRQRFSTRATPPTLPAQSCGKSVVVARAAHVPVQWQRGLRRICCIETIPVVLQEGGDPAIRDPPVAQGPPARALQPLVRVFLSEPNNPETGPVALF